MEYAARLAEEARATSVDESVSAMLNDVLPSEDALDSAGFDPIEHLNSNFPTSASLSGLETYVGELRTALSRSDDNILEAVELQMGSVGDAKSVLDTAKGRIEVLGSVISDIADSSGQCADVVRSLSTDICRLDSAKRHLVATITLMRNLAMLEVSVKQLDEAVNAQDMATAAGIAPAVVALAGYMRQYAGTGQRVSGLLGSATSATDRLTALSLQALAPVCTWLKSSGDAPQPEWGRQTSLAANSLSNLGPAAVAAAVRDIVGTCMKVYNSEYDPQVMLLGSQRYKGCLFNDPMAQLVPKTKLEQAEQRVMWLRGMLKLARSLEAPDGPLPTSWHIPRFAAFGWAAATRTHMVRLLQKADFSGQAPLLLHVAKVLATVERESAEDPRLAFECGGDEKKGAYSSPGGTKGGWSGALTSVFATSMSRLVSVTEGELHEALNASLKSEKWIIDSNSVPRVLPLSTSMFLHIKRTLLQYTSVPGYEHLVALAGTFNRVLIAMADGMSVKLRPTVGSLSSGLSENRPRTPAEEAEFCSIAATADYCALTASELQERLISALSSAKGSEEDEGVTLEASIDAFKDVMSNAIVVAASSVSARAGESLGILKKTELSGEGDASGYAVKASESVRARGVACVRALPPSLARSLVDQIVHNLPIIFKNRVFERTSVDVAGAQQLLVDLHTLRSACLSVYPEGGESFSNHVRREFTSTETALKALAGGAMGVADTYHALAGAGGNDDELGKLLDLAGVK